MSTLRTATYYPQYHIVRMWISPNCSGERPCKSLKEAEALVKASGVAQKLKKK